MRPAPTKTLASDACAGDLPPPPPLRAAGTALFLDLDGTLVEIAEHPDAVAVDPALPGLLARLSDRLEGRLALVSGRSLEALGALLGPVEVAMAGSHGGEFRPFGATETLALAGPLPAAVPAALSAFARAHGGLLVEPKPFSVAVHYRHHPMARDALLDAATALAATHGLGLKHGKQVVELTMPGSDKGTALARFMDLPAFAGATPLFVGDDVTDEDAFAAADRLGGAGVLVGEARPTAARWRLGSVRAVHDWLAAALTGEPPA